MAALVTVVVAVAVIAVAVGVVYILTGRFLRDSAHLPLTRVLVITLGMLGSLALIGGLLAETEKASEVLALAGVAIGALAAGLAATTRKNDD